MEKVTLIGVQHKRTDEISGLVGLIRSIEGRRVGLEVPQGYFQSNRKVFYFGELAQELKDRGYECFAIDSPKLRKATRILSIARRLYEEPAKADEYTGLIAELKRTINPYMSPEIEGPKKEIVRDYSIAVDIFSRTTREEFEKVWKRLQKKRERAMAENIKKSGVQIAVVGKRHLQGIKSRLRPWFRIKSAVETIEFPRPINPLYLKFFVS